MKYSLNYIIRKDRINKNGTCPIYLRYLFNRLPCNVSIKYSINPIYWDNEKNYVKKTYPKFQELRFILNEFENNLINKIEEYHLSNKVYPSKSDLKKIIEEEQQEIDKPKDVKKTLEQYFQEFIKLGIESKLEKSTIAVYNYTWKKWVKYQTNQNRIFLYNEITFKVLDNFRIFILNSGFKNNTIGKYIKTMKAFLTHLLEREELDIPISFKKVVVDKEEPEFEILNQDELEIIKAECFFSRKYTNKPKVHNLSEREIMIGQIMIFLCHTGLSFVDFDNFKIKHLYFLIEGKNEKQLYIKIVRQKLKNTVTCKIPLFDVTIDLIINQLGCPVAMYEHNPEEPTPLSVKVSLLNKFINNFTKNGKLSYESRIFDKVSSQRFNKEIKDLLKKLKIDSMVNEVQTVGGIIKQKVVPKYEKISAHTGRRTFITLSLQNGVPIHILQEQTGHRKIQTLLRYYKSSLGAIHSATQKATPYQSNI
jgi:site-specific recombinase XerD